MPQQSKPIAERARAPMRPGVGMAAIMPVRGPWRPMPGPRRQEAALGTREAAFGSRNPRRLVFLHAGSVDPYHLLLGAVTLAIGCRLGDHLDEVDPAPGGSPTIRSPRPAYDVVPRFPGPVGQRDNLAACDVEPAG